MSWLGLLGLWAVANAMVLCYNASWDTFDMVTANSYMALIALCRVMLERNWL